MTSESPLFAYWGKAFLQLFWTRRENLFLIRCFIQSSPRDWVARSVIED